MQRQAPSGKRECKSYMCYAVLYCTVRTVLYSIVRLLILHSILLSDVMHMY